MAVHADKHITISNNYRNLIKRIYEAQTDVLGRILWIWRSIQDKINDNRGGVQQREKRSTTGKRPNYSTSM